MIEDNNDIEFNIQQIATRLERLELNHQRESRELKQELSNLRVELLERLQSNATTTPTPVEARIVNTNISDNNNEIQTTTQNSITVIEPKVLKRGIKVRIINNYKGNYGVVGIVERKSKSGKVIWIKDKDGTRYRKNATSVEIVEE